MQIRTLAEHPDFAATLARWHYDEWHHLYVGWSFEQAWRDLQTHGDPNRIPTTWVALTDSGELLGSVSLLVDDLPGCEHLSPWLASLFVRPGSRRQGIGSALVDRVIAEARQLRIVRLYLFTPQHEAYYAARGWSRVERGEAGGQAVTIMSRAIDSQP